MTIAVNKTNILILSIPRTGTHFTQYFLFEGFGRVVPVSTQNWLDGNNPISYKPDHCLISEHFHPTATARINQLIAADPDLKIVVPMQDLLQSCIDASLMNHKGFQPAIDEFLNTIDDLSFHPFVLDDAQPKRAKLKRLLAYCGIRRHENLDKYIAWPIINSNRPKDSITPQGNPRSVMLRDTLDGLETARQAKDFTTIQKTIPTEYNSFVAKQLEVSGKMQRLFGYGATSWT